MFPYLPGKFIEDNEKKMKRNKYIEKLI